MVSVPIVGFEEALWILGSKYKSYPKKYTQKMIKDYTMLISCIFDILDNKPPNYE